MSPSVDLATLPVLDVAGRLRRLRAEMEVASLGALLVTKLDNVRYLTGFTGSAGMLLVTSTTALLTTDGRYRDQAAEQISAAGAEVDLEIGGMERQLEAIVAAAKGLFQLGLEAASCTWAQQRRFASLLESTLVPTVGVVEQLRIVKGEGELARIERACELADVALAQVKGRLADAPSESEFAAELEFEMRRRGASGPAFETIVASGPNSAMPHARPTERTVAEGDLVVVDFGAVVDGYRSDMTRTFAVGALGPGMQELLDAVFASQRAGVHAIAGGVTGDAVDGACRTSLTEAGFGDAFLHSTGHGVGLEIHEAPAVARGTADILPVGAVVTVEPGAYLAGRGGVRIEDTVVVTESGCRPLTKSTKDYVL